MLYRDHTPIRPIDEPSRQLTYKLMMHIRRDAFGGRGGNAHALLQALSPYKRRLAAELDETADRSSQTVSGG